MRDLYPFYPNPPGPGARDEARTSEINTKYSEYPEHQHRVEQQPRGMEEEGKEVEEPRVLRSTKMVMGYAGCVYVFTRDPLSQPSGAGGRGHQLLQGGRASTAPAVPTSTRVLSSCGEGCARLVSSVCDVFIPTLRGRGRGERDTRDNNSIKD